MRSLPPVARLYIAIVWVASLLAIVPVGWIDADWPTIVVLAGAFAGAEIASSFTVSPYRITVSVSVAIALAGILLLPPSGAALVVCTMSLANWQKTRSWVQRAFNGSMLACSAWLAGAAYEVSGGNHDFTEATPSYLLPALVAASAYCLANGMILAGVIRLTEGSPITSVWKSGLGRTIPPYLGYGLLGLVIAALWQADDGQLIALLVVLPLFIARWALAQFAEEQKAYDATVQALIQAVETKDYYTRGHNERVARASDLIAKQLRIGDDRRQSLYFAAILHDVGKLGVPTRILQKSGPLTADEWEAIQLHPTRGHELLREIGFLREAYAGILHHHERIDGKGYPSGLSGQEIPQFARIIGVADALDSMTSTRAYRGAKTVDEAIEELRRCAGTQFDPVIVDALIKTLAEHEWQPYAAAPPPDEELSAVTQYDHDDPTITIPVIRHDGVSLEPEPSPIDGERT